jgi:hypothetical protein
MQIHSYKTMIVIAFHFIFSDDTIQYEDGNCWLLVLPAVVVKKTVVEVDITHTPTFTEAKQPCNSSK